jgi:hypothetical protein
MIVASDIRSRRGGRSRFAGVSGAALLPPKRPMISPHLQQQIYATILRHIRRIRPAIRRSLGQERLEIPHSAHDELLLVDAKINEDAGYGSRPHGRERKVISLRAVRRGLTVRMPDDLDLDETGHLSQSIRKGLKFQARIRR